MRLLVFEFISGGGLVNEALPDNLAREGLMMRTALLDDLSAVSNLELIVLNDVRISEPQVKGSVLTIKPSVNLRSYLTAIQDSYEAVWLIAPESSGILVDWQRFFMQQNKQLFLSGEKALSLCQHKLHTIQHLEKFGISCVSSQKYDSCLPKESGEWVLKPMDSIACEQTYLLQTRQDWLNKLPKLISGQDYLLQPYIKGRVLSLSVLFFQGECVLICCNQQHMSLVDNQFQFDACTVNINQEKTADYQALCSQIALAIPDLWGYIGIDLIETEQGQLLVLEINPRLTSSYVGIKAATGLNVAEHVLALLDKNTPVLQHTKSASIQVTIH